MRPSTAPSAQSTASHTQSAALRGTGRQAGVQEAGGSRCSPLRASPRYSLLIIRGQRAALTAPCEAPQGGWISVTSGSVSPPLPSCIAANTDLGAEAGLMLSSCKGDGGKAGGSGRDVALRGAEAGGRTARAPCPAPRPEQLWGAVASPHGHVSGRTQAGSSPRPGDATAPGAEPRGAARGSLPASRGSRGPHGCPRDEPGLPGLGGGAPGDPRRRRQSTAAAGQPPGPGVPAALQPAVGRDRER